MNDPILDNRLLSRVQAGIDEAESRFRSRALSAGLSEGETAVCLFFPDGSLWTHGSDSAPLLSTTLMVWTHILQDRRPQDSSAILISNDPYDGGGTTCDLRMIAPVPMGDSGTGWISVLGHYADLGGSVVGSAAPRAKSIHEEGLRLPLATLDDGVLEVISANSRFRDVIGTDLEAHVEAVRCGQDWMQQLGERHDWGSVVSAGRSLQERSRSALAAASTELSEGSIIRRDRLDPEGPGQEPRHLRLEVRVDPDRIEMDFEGTGPACPGPTNCVGTSTVAAALCGFRLLFPEVPPCGFGIDDLEIRLPHGSLLDAGFPFAVGGTTDILSDRLVSLVVEALSQSVHGRGKACDGDGGNVLVLEGIQHDRPFALRVVAGAGGGASGHGDGLSNTDAATRHSAMASIEALERAFPVRVHRYEERVGTGGAGRYRGGDGTVFEVELLCSDGNLTVYADRSLRGAGGHHRGGRGTTAEIEVLTDGRWESPEAAGRRQGAPMKAGDRVRIRTAGGGGYGHPYERAIRLLSEDVRSGRLTRKEAAKQHGVIFTSTDARDYDSAKTFKLRSYRLTSSDVDDFLDEIEALED